MRVRLCKKSRTVLFLFPVTICYFQSRANNTFSRNSSPGRTSPRHSICPWSPHSGLLPYRNGPISGGHACMENLIVIVTVGRKIKARGEGMCDTIIMDDKLEPRFQQASSVGWLLSCCCCCCVVKMVSRSRCMAEWRQCDGVVGQRTWRHSIQGPFGFITLSSYAIVIHCTHNKVYLPSKFRDPYAAVFSVVLKIFIFSLSAPKPENF